MSKAIKILKLFFPLALGIFLCWYAYSQFNEEQLAEIKQKFLQADYFYIGLSVFFGFLSNVSRALRWQLLLTPLGYSTRWSNRIMAVFSGYLINITIPRSGEISRALVVNRYDGVPFDKAFGTIISERVIDLLLLLFFTLLAFLIQFDVISHFLLDKIPFTKLIIVSLILIVGGIFLVRWVFRSNSRWVGKFRYFLNGLKEGILVIGKLQKRKWFIFHTLFIWLMYLLMFYVAFFALPETTNVAFSTVITAFVVGSFAIAFTNGGFGSYPFFIAEILSLFGIALVAGTAFGWIVWASQFFMILCFGGLSFVLLPWTNRSNNKK
ncbi:lysylphosphatidylglycerol synthase transmembrane domain-containing protein [Capnocytophaga canimorsus]|uniref:lysylphosphatidylglycerol synthase transmembrane domain-containing protein n=1 Tax=Capnocytophaga canimorsus TaxID=28188 RepID=UPI00385D40C1